MERRDYDYYEANAFYVRLQDMTSSEGNANIIKRLRDGDDNLERLFLVRAPLLSSDNFTIREGDDLGWLGYFIGKSRLQDLYIWYLPEGEGGELIDAFIEGIARNQYIRILHLDGDTGLSGMMVIYLLRNITGIRMNHFSLRSTNLSDDGFASVIRALGSQSHLEELALPNISNLGRNGCSALRAMLESGVWTLKSLRLCGNNIGDDGAAALANGFASIGSSLRHLYLSNNAISSGGLSALVAGLAYCTTLWTLDLSLNDFSFAATGLGSLSDLLQRNQMKLIELCLSNCAMNDEGLQGLTEGAANHCKILHLGGNQAITASGLRSLSNSMRSESCRLEELFLFDYKMDVGLNIGDDGAEVLARGLVGNKSLKCLCFDFDDDADRDLAWPAFCTSLCDTSSVNNTCLLSNHTLHELEIRGRAEFEQGFLFHVHVWNREDFPSDVRLLLQLNKEHPQHAAVCKILMSHAHLEMVPFFQWKLKFLPLALAWFERAAPCTTLTIHDNDPNLSRHVLEESDEAFQSRKLTAMYEFVREMSMEVLERREDLIVVAYSDVIARIEEEKKSLREELERRDRQIKQLEEENKRLMALKVEWYRVSHDVYQLINSCRDPA
jgi:hypothetical protein